MQAGQGPAVTVAHEYLRHAKLAVGGLASVCCLLSLTADRDGRLAEVTDLDLVPDQGAGLQAAGRVALEPLGLVEHEAERADQSEVGGRDLAERGGVGVLLGPGPPFSQCEDLCAGVTAHRDSSCSSDVPSADVPSADVPSAGVPSAGVPSAGVPSAGADIGCPRRYICGGLLPA